MSTLYSNSSINNLDQSEKKRNRRVGILVGCGKGQGISRFQDPEEERPIFYYHVHLRRYKCYECNYSNSKCVNLTSHFLNLHTSNGIPDYYKCLRCGYTNIHMPELIRHKSRCRKADLEKLNSLQSSMHGNPSDAVKTINTHCNNSKPHVCVECNRRFRRLKYLLNHMIEFHPLLSHRLKNPYFDRIIKRFHCSFCSAKFVKQISLKVHIRQAHKVEISENIIRIWRCPMCSFYALSKSSYARHSSGHLLQNGVCSLCKSVFESKKDLAFHINKEHSRSGNTLQNHVQDSSPTQEREIAQPNTSQEANQRIHEREELKSWKLRNEENLKRVQMKVESLYGKRKSHRTIAKLVSEGLRPVYVSKGKKGILKCIHCEDYQCYDTYQLRLHFKLKHLNVHACGDCRLICRSLEETKAHQQVVHQTSMPGSFICDVCGKRFNQNVSLKRHMLIHAKTQNHICPVCDQKFNQRCSMKRHLLTHKKIKPFECKVCAMAYTQLYPLKQHLKNKHPGVDEDENIVRKDTSGFYDNVYEKVTKGGNLQELNLDNRLETTPKNKSKPKANAAVPAKHRTHTTWTAGQTAKVQDYFKTWIDSKKNPVKSDIMSFMDKTPEFPFDWKKVQKKIVNEITKRMRQKQKMRKPCLDEPNSKFPKMILDME